MAQRSQMYYAYFRFYIDESQIEAGLDKYCTEWEHMFEVGYNYKEYKCFVDNIGGFEHFVGDMRGYISQTRETGFIDGSPSDAVYDSTLLMGAQKFTDDDVVALNCVPRSNNIYIRKITAIDAGVSHKFKLSCGDAIITHPCMYTIDRNQIEILKPAAAIVDDSDVDSYEYTADLPVAFLKGGVLDSITGGSVANFANMVDRDKTTYGIFTAGTAFDMIIDMGENFNACSVYFKTRWTTNWSWTVISSSPDKVSWTTVGQDPADAATDLITVGNNNLPNARYLKFDVQTYGGNSYLDLYRILCS